MDNYHPMEPLEPKDIESIRAERSSVCVAFGFGCGIIVTVALGIGMYDKTLASAVKSAAAPCVNTATPH